MKTLTIIPSRLSATRLPGKPLLKINDISIISHVFRRAQEANIGDVVVAAEDEEIVDDVIKNGGRAILTDRNHKTGTDRIYEAFQKLEVKNVDLIMNLQGDEPAINIEDIVSLNKKMVSNQSKMGTLAAKMKDLNDLDNENVVKDLDSAGAKVVDSLESIPKDKPVLFRAHGTSVETWDNANKKNMNIIDATCPLVLEIHDEVKKLEAEGNKIINLKNSPIIFTKTSSSSRKFKALTQAGCKVVTMSALEPQRILRKLSSLNIQSVLIEGGGKVFSNFLK